MLARIKNKHWFYLGIILLWLPFPSTGQEVDAVFSGGSEDYNDEYITSFSEQINARLYLSRKFTNFVINTRDESSQIHYEPNSTLNLGIGATYKSFTLNLALGFGFLNPEEGKGDTKYLDLQSHIYTRKLVIDLFGQFYNGMYLQNSAALEYPEEQPFYLRPDIEERILGVSAFYVFKHEKYSFRSALVQNEFQKKSAGSFLVGMEAYIGEIDADSSLVPYFVEDGLYPDYENYKELSFRKIGPSGGYAHTFVIGGHFFLMLAATVNLGFGTTTTKDLDGNTESNFKISPGAIGRSGFGYNSENWYLGLTSVTNSISVFGKEDISEAGFNIGNVRLNYVKRFNVPEKWKGKFRKKGIILTKPNQYHPIKNERIFHTGSEPSKYPRRTKS